MLRLISISPYQCVEQKVRDEGLQTLTKLMITEAKWVLSREDDPQEDAVKNIRIIWEGLFYGKENSP